MVVEEEKEEEEEEGKGARLLWHCAAGHHSAQPTVGRGQPRAAATASIHAAPPHPHPTPPNPPTRAPARTCASR